MDLKEAEKLSKILKENGDEVLNATSRLCISGNLLKKMNESFRTIFKLKDVSPSNNFHVLPQDESSGVIEQFLDIHLLYDFVQKTVGLKLFSDSENCNENNQNHNQNEYLDISIFRNLKLLEVRKLSLNLLRGLKNLRTQLEYLICIKTMNNLKEVFESCGGDCVQGYIWNELKEVVFSHNGIDDLDASLEFLPQLNSIDLSHNQIQNADCINSLSNLNYLNLSFNCLSSIHFSGQLCTKLQILIIKNNYIDDIKEIGVLVNLKELDLSDNCLIDHTQLYPITNLLNLTKLNLKGNPLSYHPLHRTKTAMYLHVKSPESFKLENQCLSKSEKRLLGSLYPMSLKDDGISVDSISINTLNTVIPNVDKNDVSCDENEDESLQSEIVQETQGMQDSGFDAGHHRCDSPTESIDRTRSARATLIVVADVHGDAVVQPSSADSLQSSNEDTVKYCESDIEILSNPSQSSIEVISNRSCPRFSQSPIAVHHTISDPCTKSDLKKKKNPKHDMRKSL